METRICLGALLIFSFCWPRVSDSESPVPATAVVELFTSEGCSSCPPADRLLGQLAGREWKNGQVYTPQMIVDGQVAFIGSSQRSAVTAIEAALTQVDDIAVDLDDVAVSEGIARLHYRLSATRKGLDLIVALVERQTSTDVRRGENAGRVLEHRNVVRMTRVIPVGEDPAGETKLEIPDDTSAAALDVIVYVQDRASLAVLGARSVPLTRGS